MKNQKNKLFKILIALVVLLIVFVVIAKRAGWISGNETQVTVEKPMLRTIIETVSASGKIQPEVEVKISPDVSGEIIELHVKEGDRVKKGQLLVKIRPDVYESYLDRANASLNNAKANYANAQAQLLQIEAEYNRNARSFERNKTLHKDRVISDSEYETAYASFETAKANVEAAKQSVLAAKYNIASAEAGVKEANDNLVKTTIFAPVDGTVSVLNVELGERVVGTSQMAGTEMMRIANLSSMEVSVDVNENDINRLSLNDTAMIEIDAFLDKKFKGVVTEIANSASIIGSSADQVTNFSVKIRILPESYVYLLKEDQALPSPFRPGLSATVDIQTEKVTNVLTIPIQAVTTRSDTSVAPSGKSAATSEKKANKTQDETREYVFTVVNGSIKKMEVKSGIQDDMYIQILSGLTENDEVVIAPYLAISKNLKEGDLVKIVERDKLFEVEKRK